jgi:acyl carrier protein
MKASESSIEERVKKVIIERLQISMSDRDLARETPLIGKGLGLDSVGILELVVGIEEEFDVVLDDSEISLELFECIGSLSDYISKKSHDL